MVAKKMIVVAGPTAVGKTSTAIKMAQHFNTEIISADSRQFYHDLKIGTAYPSPAELASVKHHLVGNLELDQYYNVSIFENQALQIANEIFEKSDYTVVVGGSGLYINALCNGIDDLPDADEYIRNSIKSDYEKFGLEWLQNQVQTLDPEYFEIVDKKNPKRLMRALEVCKATGKTYTSLRVSDKKERPFKIIKIALNLPREELFGKIATRVDLMIDCGLVDEAKSMLRFRNLNSLNTVGYKEIFSFIEGKTSLEQSIEDIKTNTRRYAKRQITWFKKDEEFKWFSPNDFDEIISYIQNQ